MKTFVRRCKHIRSTVTSTELRVGLAVVSLLAMALAGSAGEHWT